MNNIKARETLLSTRTPNYARAYDRYIGLHGLVFAIPIPINSKEVIWKNGKFNIDLPKDYCLQFPSYLTLKGNIVTNAELQQSQKHLCFAVFIVYDIEMNGSYKERLKYLRSLFYPEKKRNMPIKFRGPHIQLADIYEKTRIETEWDSINELFSKTKNVYLIEEYSDKLYRYR
jgi:hypothetical protein